MGSKGVWVLVERAKVRFQSGHIDLTSLKYVCTECKCADNDILEDIHFFGANVKPSMIANVNYVQLAFDKNYNFISSPTSRCACVDGLGFCSHMLALIIFFRQCQLFPGRSYEWHKNRMPDYVDEIYKEVVPLLYMLKNI